MCNKYLLRFELQNWILQHYFLLILQFRTVVMLYAFLKLYKLHVSTSLAITSTLLVARTVSLNLYSYEHHMTTMQENIIT